MFDFTGKKVVVTGGLSGIGRATALAFAESNAEVYVLDITHTALSLHPNIQIMLVDVADEKNVLDTAKNIGAIDILVSNAGIEYNDVGNLVSMPRRKLDRILEVNLGGAINCVRAFMPKMHKGGRVVFVSSTQAFMACHPGTSYQASKAGLIGLAKGLAIEYARLGINVNVICPGGVATEGMGAVRAGDSGLDDFKRHCPIGRRAHPHEIAKPILFLCSEWASYITGATLVVDGGVSSLGMPYPPLGAPVDNDPDV
jgi:NAD(P)-dependent dehydrogenase (short-subunit alcohol dehydrogenase family)